MLRSEKCRSITRHICYYSRRSKTGGSNYEDYSFFEVGAYCYISIIMGGKGKALIGMKGRRKSQYLDMFIFCWE